MGAINVKHTGSGAAIALSSDGTSLLLDGTAIGGGGAALELYAENPSTPTAPSVTGSNAVAIGSGSVSSGDRSIAIGNLANATSLRAFAVGVNATASGSNAISMGGNSASSGSSSVAIGNQANSSSSYGLALGHNAKTATGADAVAIGQAYASGTDSFAAAISTNSSSYGASGSGSVAMMNWAKASGSNSGAIGFGANATGSFAHAFGAQSFATASSSLALGKQCQATANYATSIGRGAINPIKGSFKFSGSYFSAAGDSQIGMYPLQIDTSDATPVVLVTDENSTPGAGTNNQVILPNNSVYGFTGTIIARENSAQTNDFAVWEVKGGAVRAASAATTALGSYNINKISESTGAAAWAIAISADTTNGAIAFTVTGEASHSIRWVATINTTEVTY